MSKTNKMDMAWVGFVLATIAIVVAWMLSFPARKPKRVSAPAALICHNNTSGLGMLCRDDKEWRQDV
jgi:hypothetical protein